MIFPQRRLQLVVRLAQRQKKDRMYFAALYTDYSAYYYDHEQSDTLIEP